MMLLLASVLLTAQAAPVTDMEEVVVSLPRPEVVYCVRFYKEPGSRTPKFTCKTHVEWRAVKAAQHDTRTRTAAKLMDRGFLMDTALVEQAVSTSVRPSRRR